MRLTGRWSLREAKYCVTGYELELESVKYLVKKAKSLGIRTILNPSPVPNQAPDFWGFVDILVLNEVEVAHMLRLAGCPPAEQWEKNAALLPKYLWLPAGGYHFGGQRVLLFGPGR